MSLSAGLQEARELREVYSERDNLQSQIDALNLEVTARTHALRLGRLNQVSAVPVM